MPGFHRALVARRRADCGQEACLHRRQGIVAQRGRNRHATVLQVRSHERVADPYHRRRSQLDRLHDAAVVGAGAGILGHRLVAVGDFAEDIPVDRLIGGVEHAHVQQVRRPGPERGRRIQVERRFAAFGAAQQLAVQPNLAQIIYAAVEVDQYIVDGIRQAGRRELAPIPGDTIEREHLLNHAGNRRRPGAVLDRRKPPTLAAAVVRVRQQLPLAGQPLDATGGGGYPFRCGALLLPGRRRGRQLAGSRGSLRATHRQDCFSSGRAGCLQESAASHVGHISCFIRPSVGTAPAPAEDVPLPLPSGAPYSGDRPGSVPDSRPAAPVSNPWRTFRP